MELDGVDKLGTPIKVMAVFGTRPEAVKMAPLVHEMKKHPRQIQPLVAVTAQHREMLDQVLDVFSIEPDFDLDIMQRKQSLAHVTTKALEGLDNVIKKVKPDLVLVHGDTTTTFAASLSALYNETSVGHVEAGLRTWRKDSPFPEEMNRQLTGVLADLHFAPTKQAEENLLKENKNKDTIFVTGNTAIDALKTTVDTNYHHDVLDRIGEDKLILMTAHRRENLGEPLHNIFRAVRRIVEENEDVQVVYPVHLNPLVQEAAEEELGGNSRIHLIKPLGVIDFHNFASRAYMILTDSGGVQEEAPSLGIPVLVLRDTTERPEGITAGTLKLVGTGEENVYKAAHSLLYNRDTYNNMAKASNPYGDGRASERIVEAILYYFKRAANRPQRFMG